MTKRRSQASRKAAIVPDMRGGMTDEGYGMMRAWRDNTTNGEAHSPDLNPIETLWALLKDDVSKSRA